MRMASLISVLILLFSCMNKVEDGSGNREHKMSPEDKMKTSFSYFISRAWNEQDLTSLDRMLDDDYTLILNGIRVAGNTSEMKATMNVYFTGFPDGRITLQSMLVLNDHLVAKWTYQGIHTGVYGEIPATGKRIHIGGYAVVAFDSRGKITGEEVYYNELELLQQLGYTLQPPNME